MVGNLNSYTRRKWENTHTQTCGARQYATKKSTDQKENQIDKNKINLRQMKIIHLPKIYGIQKKAILRGKLIAIQAC